MSKLYLQRLGDTYGEQHTVEAESSACGANFRSRFRLDAMPQLVSVRFDPATQAGIYRIFDICWRDPASGAELVRYDTTTLPHAGIGTANGARLPSPPGSPLTFWAMDPDPHIELSWPSEVRARRAPVFLDVEWGHEPMQEQEAAEIALRLLGIDRDQLLETADAAAHRLAVSQVDDIARSKTDYAQQQRSIESTNLSVVAIAVKLEQIASGFVEFREQLREQMDARINVAIERAHGANAVIRHELGSVTLQLAVERAALIATQNEFAAIHLQNQQAIAEIRESLSNGLLRLEYALSEVATPKWRRWCRVLRERGGSAWLHLSRNFFATLDLLRIRRFSAQAAGDIEFVAAARNTTTWRASGSDPRFSLLPLGSGTPSAGWYTMCLKIYVDNGQNLIEPALYVDYGAGMCEAGKIVLRFSPKRDVQRTLVKFTGDVQALRLDPSTQPCSFTMGGVSFRKLSAAEAALRLAAPVFSQLRRLPRQLPSAFRDAFRVWRQHGIGEIEKRLRALYDERSRDAGYDGWVSRFDTLSAADLAAIAQMITHLPSQPKISILLPVYNTPEKWLRRCIDSVIAQVYPNWQLCIADDASTLPHVQRVLQEYAEGESRIRYTTREKNGHISAASNSALELVDGEYVALLDHDDELPAHALYLVAERIAQEPELMLIYSDEDKIDEHGRRYDPYFKPDWNPALFLSQNFVCHLGVYRTDLVRKLGGFRLGYEGSQDYDLALRCSEHLERIQIGHIPHVLYHWRSVAGSTALAGSEKSYTADSSQRALEDHFRRKGEPAVVERTKQGYFRSRYLQSDPVPLVSLIIPTRDRVELLRMCVQSILKKTDYASYEILIVDNQSVKAETLAYFESLKGDPHVRVLPYDQPFNFSAINNFAAAQARGQLIGLINNDIEVIDGSWLSEMASYAIRSDVGAVGAKLYYPDGRIQHAGVVVGFGGVAGHSYQRLPGDFAGQMNRANLVQNMSSVTAACLLLRRDVFEAVGGLDEGLSVAFNDIDFCLRILQQGLDIVWTPHAELYHHESASRGYEDSPEKLERFHREIHFMQARWGDRLKVDPAYNPNLALEGEPFELSWQPRVEYSFRNRI